MKIGKQEVNKLILSALCLIALGYGSCGYAGGGHSKSGAEQPTSEIKDGDNTEANQEQKDDQNDGKERETTDAVGTPAVPAAPVYHFEVSEDGKSVTIGDSTPERIVTTIITREYAEEIVERLKKTPRQHIIFNSIRFEPGAFTIMGDGLSEVTEVTIDGHSSDDDNKGIRELITVFMNNSGIRLTLNFIGATPEAMVALANLSQKSQLMPEVVAEMNAVLPADNQVTLLEFDRTFMIPVQRLIPDQATQLAQSSSTLTSEQDQTVRRNQLINALAPERREQLNLLASLHNEINVFLYQQPNAERHINGIWLNPPVERAQAPSVTTRAMTTITNALWTIGTLNGRLARATAPTVSIAAAVTPSSTPTASTTSLSSPSSSIADTGTAPAIVAAEPVVTATALPGMLSRVNMNNIVGAAFRTIGTPFVYVARGAVAIGNAAATVARATRNAAVTAATTTGSAVATAAGWVVGVPGRVGHGIAERFRRAPVVTAADVLPSAVASTEATPAARRSMLNRLSLGLLGRARALVTPAPVVVETPAALPSAVELQPSVASVGVASVEPAALPLSTNVESSRTPDINIIEEYSPTNDPTGNGDQTQNVIPVSLSTTLLLNPVITVTPVAGRGFLSLLGFGGSGSSVIK